MAKAPVRPAPTPQKAQSSASPPRKTWTWRHAIMDSDLPGVTRAILQVLACHMNDVGGGCFPSQELIARRSGYSVRSVREHLQLAEELCWIRREEHGFRGQKWRSTEYYALWPERGAVMAISQGMVINDASYRTVHPDEEVEDVGARVSIQKRREKRKATQDVVGEGGKRAAPPAARSERRSGTSRQKVRNDVPTNSSYTSTEPLTPNPQTEEPAQDVGAQTEHVHATVDPDVYELCCKLTGKKPGLTDSRGGWTFPAQIVAKARGDKEPK